MDLKQFRLIEVYGLSETINEYTINHYIKNYTRLMVEFSKNENLDCLLVVVERLIDWYESEIDVMRQNVHLYNFKEHEKSFDLLKEVQKILILQVDTV
jgi:hypothetical protein